LQILKNSLLLTFETSTPALSSSFNISLPHLNLLTYINGEGSVNATLETLNQKLSISREKGAIPGPSKLKSGSLMISFLVMLAICTHCGAVMHISFGLIPAVSTLYKIN